MIPFRIVLDLSQHPLTRFQFISISLVRVEAFRREGGNKTSPFFVFTTHNWPCLSIGVLGIKLFTFAATLYITTEIIWPT